VYQNEFLNNLPAAPLTDRPVAFTVPAMLFNSLVFLAFMAVVLLLYPRLRHRAQNYFLLVASYTFYGYWD